MNPITSPRITERAQGLVREAVADVQRSIGCDAVAAANIVACMAMEPAPVKTDLIDEWLEESQ